MINRCVSINYLSLFTISSAVEGGECPSLLDTHVYLFIQVRAEKLFASHNKLSLLQLDTTDNMPGDEKTLLNGMNQNQPKNTKFKSTQSSQE